MPDRRGPAPWWFAPCDNAFVADPPSPADIAAGDLVNVDLADRRPHRRSDVYLVDEGFGPTLRFVKRVRGGFKVWCPNAAVAAPRHATELTILGRALRVRRLRIVDSAGAGMVQPVAIA